MNFKTRKKTRRLERKVARRLQRKTHAVCPKFAVSRVSSHIETICLLTKK